jgi:hypothetical protein
VFKKKKIYVTYIFSLFVWTENKPLKVLLADLCEKKTLLVS